MKKQYTIAATLISLFILAGCNKSQTESNVPVTTPGPVPKVAEKPVPADVRNFSYYQAHLDEARETWHQCQQVKPEDITEAIRARCDAAQTAWSTQPYKPASRK